MWLSNDDFRRVVDATPLISIDLVVTNTTNQVLLGRRLNRPAQGFWFVPGGRILKNEKLDDAFKRLSLTELGFEFERESARLLNVYEHFYSDSVFGDEESAPDTHYVVLGYQIVLPDHLALTPKNSQHAQFKWWSLEDMEQDSSVHENTRAYLQALV